MRDRIWFQWLSGVMAGVMCCHVVTVSFAVTLASMAMPAWAVDEKVSELKAKYNTDDPDDNFTGTQRVTDLSDQYGTGGAFSRNIESELATEYTTGGGVAPDLSPYTLEFDTRYSQAQADMAGTTGSIPSMNSDHSINVSYSQNGAQLVQRDSSTGELVFIDNPDPGQTGHVIDQTQVQSAEMGHSQSVFNVGNYYDEESDFKDVAKEDITDLKSSTNSAGIAYQSFLGMYNNNRPANMSPQDSVLNFGFDSLDQVEAGTGIWETTCSDTTTTVTTERNIPNWEEFRCMEPKRDNPSSCNIERTASLPFRLVSFAGNAGDYTLSFDDARTVRLSVGRDEGNYLSDARLDGGNEDQCKVYAAQFVFEVDPGISVARATRSRIRIDDALTMWINNSFHRQYRAHSSDESNSYWAQVPDSALTLPRSRYANHPMDFKLWQDHVGTGNIIKCDHHTTSDNSSVDVTSEVSNMVNGNKIVIEYLLGVGGLGEVFYEFVIEFDQDVKPLQEVIQEPEGCAEKVGWSLPGEEPCTPGEDGCITDQFCSYNSISCLDEGARGFDQALLNQIGPFFEGDTANVCWEANFDGYFCDPLAEQPICNDFDLDGEEECYDYEMIRNLEDQCLVYREDPTCVESYSECSEGWEDPFTGTCYVQDTYFECNTATTITQTEQVTTNVCLGDMPCLGNDCDFGTDQVNIDFEAAVAQLSVLDYMGHDANCTDPSDPNTCEIFAGEPRYCTWDATSVSGVDCCEKPAGVSMVDYFVATKGMMDIEAYLATNTDYLPGYWMDTREAIGEGLTTVGEKMSGAWESVSSSISSGVDSLLGSESSEVVSSAGEVLGDVTADLSMDSLKQAAMEFLYEHLPEELAQTLFVQSGSGATTTYALSSVAETAVNVVGGVMAAYTAYQMVKLGLTLITKCEDEEMDMGLKIAQKSCMKEGRSRCNKEALGVCIQKIQDWCCFNSPLARIIMEQAYPMLGKSPVGCNGLTPGELASLDWEAIDLTEWVNMMLEADLMPESSEITMDSLTGDGRILNPYGRDNVEDRTADRLETSTDNLTDRADEANTLMDADDVDCSIVPAPPICDYGLDLLNPP
ncbi:conjugal transfer protein TraN [Neiella sp. HB171785]|uniref:Conjugal transfer protein TraN n=1 Tax=Neiella litorisoli TaxID=2771431 RepID=A0A8J6QUR2_9GAMM|nr:conjugal transfer protein TraN [Neiella litorisoli]MBD1389383.1 conjugal transfer protein TraN [Neiella litorisoli]